MIKTLKRCVCAVLTAVLLMSVMTVGLGVGTLTASAGSWNGTNYGGGSLRGYRSFLEAFGIDYDVYMKWLDDHDADSPNPNYYLGTPYVEFDHRNPRGDVYGCYGDYDEPGVPAMNCTGFVWHVLYKSAVMSGASYAQTSRLEVMWRVPESWDELGVYRIYFDSLEEAYDSGVLEKGDVMWIYGSSDNHNAIFYGDSPKDFIYWDSAGERNRYCEVHAIGDCLGLLVAKASQPNKIELHIRDSYSGDKTFGAKYCIFDDKSLAEAAAKNPDDTKAWNKRIGAVAMDSSGYGYFREASTPSANQLWVNGVPQNNLSYFRSAAKRVSAADTYYAVQWTPAKTGEIDYTVREFKYSGERTPTGYRIYTAKVPKKVATPKISEMKSTGEGVKISWKAVRDADRYRVYYKSRTGDWVRMTETASTSYLDTDVKVGTSYTYTIRCVDDEGDFISDFDHTGWKYTYKPLDTPILSHETVPEGVLLSWQPVEGSYKYRVYYKNGKGGWTRMTETDSLEYLDTDVRRGGTYTYTIRCVDADGDFASDFNRTGWAHTIYLDTPEITGVDNVISGAKLTWTPVAGAYQYRVFYLGEDDWKRLGITSSTSFVDKTAKSGEARTYTVRCVDANDRYNSDFERTGVTSTFVSSPEIETVTSADGGVYLAWAPVSGAYGYRVFHKTADGWERLATTAETSYLDTSAESGKSYTYTVRCIGEDDNYVSDHLGGRSVNYIATPQIDRIYSTNDGVVLSWQPVAGAYQYRVFYKGKNGWTRMGTTRSTEFTDEVVKNGTTYLYTVRCMDKNGEYISDYHHEGWYSTYIGNIDFSLSNTADGVQVDITPVDGVSAYRVFKRVNNEWTRVGTTSELSLIDTQVNQGESLIYTVRGVDDSDSYITGFLKTGKTIKVDIPEQEIKETGADMTDSGIAETSADYVGSVEI